MNREEFEKWWHGDDTSRHPTNSYEGAICGTCSVRALSWAYEGWVRGATAEREACARLAETAASSGAHVVAEAIRARGGE